MAGRSPKEAVTHFVGPIRSATGCFLGAGEVTVDSEDPETEGVLTLNDAKPVALPRIKGGTQRISVSISMRYRIVRDPTPTRGPWKVSTSAWIYGLYENDRQMLAFHWHPESNSRVVTPHLHVHTSTLLRKRHVPTGRVLIEDVLALAVELGAAPRDAKAWARVTQRNRAAFLRGATWGQHVV